MPAMVVFGRVFAVLKENLWHAYLSGNEVFTFIQGGFEACFVVFGDGSKEADLALLFVIACVAIHVRKQSEANRSSGNALPAGRGWTR
jgi:hypothetical protein